MTRKRECVAIVFVSQLSSDVGKMDSISPEICANVTEIIYLRQVLIKKNYTHDKLMKLKYYCEFFAQRGCVEALFTLNKV